MTKKDALAWGNAELKKMGLAGMMRFRAGKYSGGEACVDLISTDNYPDHVEGLLIDYEFADDYRTAIGRLLLMLRMQNRY